MQFSKRITNMQASPIRKLVNYAQKAKANGVKVYHLNIGQPDIETPTCFMEAIGLYNEKVLAYSHSQGTPELIEAIIQYYSKHHIHFEMDDILITNGASEAVTYALTAIADPGDEVLVPEPFYSNYNIYGASVNVIMTPITCLIEKGFHLPSKKTIEESINPRTKGILLSNPGNPTGVVYTKKEVRMLANLAAEYDLFIIADEVYREFVYDDLEYTSFGHMKHVEDRVIIIDSISKRFSACGARIGSLASKNKELMAQILKICQGRLSVPTLEQLGAIELYKMPDTYFESVKKEYTKRRDLVYHRLVEIPGVLCDRPEGAFYIIAILPVDDAEKFALWMLEDFSYENSTVMLAPAGGFYSTAGEGKNEVRIAYVLNENELHEGMKILKIALDQYPDRIDPITI